MKMSLASYELLARLFSQPGPRLEADADAAIAAHREAYPAAAQALERFRELLPAGEPLALQELYTRTFDVQAITSLDIGYTLFGEDYKRGALLANLSAEHRKAGTDCGAELADHLPNVLRLLPRLADLALREELVQVLLAPAVREMIREFEPARLAKKEELYRKHHKTIIEVAAGDTRTAYRHALEALYEVLRRDFSLKVSLPIEQESKFAGSVSAEMGIESCGPCAGS
jgi:nitrate reductase assembly molybdenum cofactor insertion protein NarJ